MDSTGVDSIDTQVSQFINWLQEDSSNAGMVELLVVGNEAVLNVFQDFATWLTLGVGDSFRSSQ